MNRDLSVIFETASKHCILDSFVDYDGYSISSKGFLPTVVDIMITCIKFTISVWFSSLIPKMSTFTLAISWLTHFQLALIHGPNISDSYAILLFIALDFTSITSHIHNWVLFLLWLHLFILSGVISPLISSNILDTYWPGEFIQCPVFLPFHTVHEVLKARILKWFVIPFSSGLRFVRTLHHDPSILDGPARHGHSFTELDKAVVH